MNCAAHMQPKLRYLHNRVNIHLHALEGKALKSKKTTFILLEKMC